MKTYWDLEEKERAQLSAEEVERFADAELMLKGVLKVQPLKLTEVPEMPAPDMRLVFVKHSFREADIGFTNEVDADNACDAGYYIASEYVNGQSVEVAYDFKPDNRSFTTKAVYSERLYKQLRPTIEKASAARTANERAEREYDEARKKQAEALAGMWTDWHDCNHKHAELGRVVNTFRDYEKTAGRPDVAAKFLSKVFSAEQIAEAAAWFDVTIPVADAQAAE